MALNVGRDEWQLSQTALAYAAAQQLSNAGSCFKVFVSLDMSSFSAASLSAPDGTVLQPFVTNFKSHPAQYYYQGRHFVSTYGGGSASTNQIDWINTFKAPLLAEQGIDVYFLPAYSIEEDAATAYATAESDGQFLWNAWPNDAATGQPTDTSISPALTQEYIINKGSKSFMANVSPWFFTHFDNTVKNMIFHSEGLWQQRWTDIVNLRADIDFVQITSWNDFGESHYIGPADTPDISFAADNFGYSSLDWVEDANGNFLDHSSWADEARAWILAFKTGTFPTIEALTGTLDGSFEADRDLLDAYYKNPNSDRAYVSYRLQYHDAITDEATDRESTGYDYAQDAIVIDTYLSTPGRIYVSWPSMIYTDTSGATVTQNSVVLPVINVADQISQTIVDFTYNGVRYYGAPGIEIETAFDANESSLYTIVFGDLGAVQTPADALTQDINFNAYTKKFTTFNDGTD